MNSWQQPVSGEPSVGTLHLIPEEDRPTSWVLSVGAATSYTDVNFSAYVPVGVKALYLNYAISWVGDGVADYSGWNLIKKGSSPTSYQQSVQILDYHQNLTSGIRRQIYGVVTVGCDANGYIQYRFYNGNTAVGALYLAPLGYYI